MTERFTPVCTLPCPLAAAGAPVMITEANLLRDTQEGTYLVRLRLRNTSFQTIRSIALQLTLQDQLGSTLEGVYQQPFAGLQAAPEEEFEEMIALADPGVELGGFTVDVTRAGFDNGEFAVHCGPWIPTAPVEEPAAPANGGQNSLDPSAAAYVPASQQSAAPAPEQTYTSATQQTYAPPAPTYAPPAPAVKPKKKKGLGVLIAVLVIVLAIGAFAAVYWSGYQSAQTLAEDWEFEEAEEKLLIPAITQLHDPELAAFVEAGRLMEDGKYTESREELDPLVQKGYLNADELLAELNYREAAALLEKGDYRAAIIALEPMAKDDYADSAELYNQARLGYARQQMADFSDYTNTKAGIELMEDLAEEGYAPAKTELPDAQKAIYEYAKELYQKGAYGTADRYFALVGDYSDSGKYQDLVDAHDYNLSFAGLWELRGFEDADDLLLTQHYLSDFLMGSWETSNGGYFFTMYSDYSTEYNLPWYDGVSYMISDGEFIIEQSNGSTRSMYRFTIVNWNQITVYCFKDGSTHTLYRQ